MNDRYVHLTPRLRCALSMLNGSGIVADIGCDHGRLTAALLQQHACEQVIAADISEPSLEKAKQLLFHIGLNDRVSFRLGNGLDVLDRSENVDAIALLGMGGTLMVELPLSFCSRCVRKAIYANTFIGTRSGLRMIGSSMSAAGIIKSFVPKRETGYNSGRTDFRMTFSKSDIKALPMRMRTFLRTANCSCPF